MNLSIYIYIKRKNREKERIFQAKLFDMTTNKVQLTDTGSGGPAEVEQVSVARLQPSTQWATMATYTIRALALF